MNMTEPTEIADPTFDIALTWAIVGAIVFAAGWMIFCPA